MFSESLSTTLEKIKGSLSEKGIITFAFVSLAIIFVWSVIALIVQGKFSKNCQSMQKFIEANTFNDKNINSLDGRAKLISSGFYNGFLKFKKAESGKPSDFITKKDALDDKANFSFLYNSKPILKFFITFTTIAFFILNLILKTGENTLTGAILGDSIFYPLIYLFFALIVYVVYCAISHHLYVVAEDKLYNVLNLMDDNFTKKVEQKPLEVYIPVQQAQVVTAQETPETKIENINEEKLETESIEPQNETIEQSIQTEESKIDDFDENDILYEVSDDVLDAESERDVENFIGNIVLNNEEQEEQKDEIIEENSTYDNFIETKTDDNLTTEENVESSTTSEESDAQKQENTVSNMNLDDVYVDSNEFLSLIMGDDMFSNTETLNSQDDSGEILNDEFANNETNDVDDIVLQNLEEASVSDTGLSDNKEEIQDNKIAENLENSLPVEENETSYEDEKNNDFDEQIDETQVVEEIEPTEQVEKNEEVMEEFTPYTFIDVDKSGATLLQNNEHLTNFNNDDEEIIVERSSLEIIDDHLLASNRKKEERVKKPETKVVEVEEMVEEIPAEKTVEEPSKTQNVENIIEEETTEPEKPKSEDDEIADLVGQFKTIQFESNENYIPEKVIENEDEDEILEDLDDGENTDESDDIENYEEEDSYEDEDLLEEENSYEDDTNDYLEDYEDLEDDTNNNSDKGVENEDLDELDSVNLFDDIMMSDDSEVEQPEQFDYSEVSQGEVQGQYFDPNQYNNGYYPPVIGYDQNGYPIYQNAGYGYAPVYPNGAGYNMQNPYGQQNYQNVNNQNNFVEKPTQITQTPEQSYEEFEDYSNEENYENELEEVEIVNEEPVEEVKTSPKQSAVKEESSSKNKGRTKKSTDHTRPKKTVKTDEEDDDKKAKNGRGRPKTKTYDSSFEIQNDEEFNDVLEDATKLMRKSDGNLSDAQRTKIEKQLAILVEAMNNYKNKED